MVAAPDTKYGLENLIMTLAAFLLNHNKQIETTLIKHSYWAIFVLFELLNCWSVAPKLVLRIIGNEFYENNVGIKRHLQV